MRAHEKRKQNTRAHRRISRRPYLIDAEDFDFMDDYELHDWMFGNPSDAVMKCKKHQ
jgi:hypothetical protein